MSEKKLWNRLHTHMLPFTPHLDRIENRVGEGQPDVNFCKDGVEGWVELKWRAEVPARASTALFHSNGLRLAQTAWIVRRHRAGGRVFIVAQVAKHFFVVSGLYAVHFNDLTLRGLTDLAAYHTEGRVVWGDVAHILFSPKRSK